MRHERFDEAVDVAIDDRGQIIKSQLDAVVGHAVLPEVVGADALVAFAGADLRFALGGILRIFLSDPAVEQARTQDG